MKIELSQIVKDIIHNNEFANPFSDSFSEVKIYGACENYISNKYNDYEITHHNEGYEIIEILTLLNRIYESLMLNIEDLIDTINLNKDELIQNILSLFNFDFFSLLDIANSEIAKDKSKLPFTLENLSQQKVQNVFGDTMDTQDVMDTWVDTFNILLEIIISFNPEIDKSIPTLSESDRNKNIRHLILNTNLFVNIQNAFNFFRFEFSKLLKKDNAIYFKYFPEMYYLKVMAGKARYSSLVHESMFQSMRFYEKERMIPKLEVTDGNVRIMDEDRQETNFKEHLNFSILVSYYYHIINQKLPYFDNITIVELTSVLTELQTCFNSFNAQEILDKTTKTQKKDFIPISGKTGESDHLIPE